MRNNEHINQWLKKLAHQYKIEIAEEHIGNQFIFDEVTVSDPRQRGIKFKISINNAKEASMITFPALESARVNIAEGYTSKDILSIAETILEGKAEVKKGVFGTKISFDTSLGKVLIKLKKGAPTLIDPYERNQGADR
jgi:hypothetical protein